MTQYFFSNRNLKPIKTIDGDLKYGSVTHNYDIIEIKMLNSRKIGKRRKCFSADKYLKTLYNNPANANVMYCIVIPAKFNRHIIDNVNLFRDGLCVDGAYYVSKDKISKSIIKRPAKLEDFLE